MVYRPTMEDLEWARMLLRSVSQKGIIAFPDAGLIYQIDHTHLTLTLTNPNRLVNFEAATTHAKTVTVFGVFGYHVNESYEFVPGQKGVPNEMQEASERLAQHITNCARCGRLSPTLCRVGHFLLRDYHYTLYLLLFRDDGSPQ